MSKKQYLIVVLFICHGMLLPVLADNSTLNNSEIKQSSDNRPIISIEKHEVFEAKAIVQEIKSKPPFVNVAEDKEWSFSNSDDESVSDINVSWLSSVINFVILLIETSLWLLPLLAIFLLYQTREYWFNLINVNELKKPKTIVPNTMFGLEIAQETLPVDIEKTAQDLWLNNKNREAVSLLYRGALAILFKQYKFELPPGATEQDCVEQLIEILQSKKLTKTNIDIEPDNDLQINQFKVLTNTWISAAYAHRFPDDVVFNQLCLHWNQTFLSIKDAYS